MNRRVPSRGMNFRLAVRLAVFSLLGLAITLGSARYHSAIKAAVCISNPVVTNNADSGAGSLRQAIADACDASTITFATTVTSPIVLQSALDIDKNLTIRGPGAGSLTISGNNAVGVFNIGTMVSAIDVTISGLTVSEGNGVFGGGIENTSTGTLTIMSVTMSNNTSSSGVLPSGGGIESDNGGTTTIIDSTISGNKAPDGLGGGIAVINATLSLVNSTVSGNSASGGGGINNSGILNITGSTISGNTAPGAGSEGGAIFNFGTLNVTNSTISGNSAGEDGGGIYNATSRTATFVNTTINGNTGGAAGDGGGIFNLATLNLTNCIIAGSGASGDCVNNGDIATNDHNLIQDGSSSPAFSGDPKLGPLQNNGGPTATMALLASSPAIDAGDDSVLNAPLSLTTDQRGPGFPRKFGTHVDIGALEFGVCSTIDATVTEGATICHGGSAMVTVSLSGGMPPYTLTLDNGGGTMTGASPLMFTVNPSMSTTYSVSSGTDSNGCSVTATGSAVVMLDTVTTATVTGGGTVCRGGMATVTVSLSGGTPPYTVALNNGGGMHSGSSPLTFIVTPSGTTTYSVSSGMDSIGCSLMATGSATATVNTPPSVTLNPVDQTIGGGSVTFTAAASGNPTPTVQWQVSTNGGATFTNIPGATSTSLTFTAGPTQSGSKYRAVFTNQCNSATTTAATLTLFDVCLKDDSSGKWLRFNSVTGQYIFTRCSDGFTISGTGIVGLASGIRTLTDLKSDRKINAGYNSGQLTGTANITLIQAPGINQTVRINQSIPHATCGCD
jgi:hypothetical protein